MTQIQKFDLLGHRPPERNVNEDFDPSEQEKTNAEATLVYSTDDVNEAFLAIRDGGFLDDQRWVVVSEIKHRDEAAKEEFLAFANGRRSPTGADSNVDTEIRKTQDSLAPVDDPDEDVSKTA